MTDLTPDNNLQPEPNNRQNSAPIFGLEGQRQSLVQEKRNRQILAGIFGVLLALVLGVIFILPKLISPLNGEPTVIVVTPTQTPQGAQITPFQEAQTLKQREAAQNRLAALLSLQTNLEEKAVETWAQDDFLQAVNFAKNGDEAYSQQDFTEAEQAYLRGLAILQRIESNSASIFSDLMDSGQNHILAGEPMEAQNAFTLAKSIMPTDPAVATSLLRAKSLAEVLALLQEGQLLEDSSQLESARSNYQQALTLDPEHIDAQSALQQVKLAIIERDFSNYMSEGYAELQKNAPAKAESAFRQALTVKPNSNQALAAIEQASDQISFEAITKHLNTAQEAVNAENWQAALYNYEQAIIVDPNLVSALNGRDQANSRQNLDQFLQNIIDSPLRLAESNVFQQAQRVMNDVKQLTSQGPRLIKQVQAVTTLLNKVNQPVNVSFLSDGLTTVTLARFSALGQFSSHTLALTPGTYVAIGVREGYRDVRQEFTVPIDAQTIQVTVLCDEVI